MRQSYICVVYLVNEMYNIDVFCQIILGQLLELKKKNSPVFIWKKVVNSADICLLACLFVCFCCCSILQYYTFRTLVKLILVSIARAVNFTARWCILASGVSITCKYIYDVIISNKAWWYQKAVFLFPCATSPVTVNAHWTVWQDDIGHLGSRCWDLLAH